VYLKDLSQSSPSDVIDLFQIDATIPSNGVVGLLYFSNSVNTNGSAPVPCQLNGVETASTGPLNNPTFTVSNINARFSPMLIEYDNLLGGRINLIKTFYKYLDGQPSANPTYIVYQNSWIINRVAVHNNTSIQFELSSPMDLQNITLPARQLTVNCSFIYRKWNPDTNEFIAGTCPFTGTSYFDVNGNPTGPSGDACGKKVNDCTLRFRKNNVLPMQAFPAVRSLIEQS